MAVNPECVRSVFVHLELLLCFPASAGILLVVFGPLSCRYPKVGPKGSGHLTLSFNQVPYLPLLVSRRAANVHATGLLSCDYALILLPG